jgi:NADH-quinone oxidoreductase subunit H
MAMLGRTFDRLSMPGKVVFTVVPVLLILGAALTAAVVVGGASAALFLSSNLPLVRFVAAATGVIVLTIPTAFVIIYLELKVIARMNLRIGPDRVGPFGALQSVIHGLKVLTKEDFTPTNADPLVFTWAPVVAFLASIMTMVVLPFAPGLFGQDFNIGLLYFFAMGGLGVVGLLMAGWSSFNKYSLLGGLRAAAQIISYEIPLTLSVVGIVLLSGSLSLNRITLDQSGSVFDWYIWRQPLAFLIFFIAATAEANRTPLDMAEADSEIVAGFATEYSGMRFGFFFFAEYVNVFILSGLAVVLFLGGWNAPFDWPWPIATNLDPASMGIGLLFALALVPALAVVGLGLPFYLVNSRLRFWQSLVIGFVLFNLVAGGALFGLAFLNFDWVVGLVWFMLKTYAIVFLFVWMRGTLPRVRIDQLMGFAWKWLLPAALLNLFVTALAILVVGNPR